MSSAEKYLVRGNTARWRSKTSAGQAEPKVESLDSNKVEESKCRRPVRIILRVAYCRVGELAAVTSPRVAGANPNERETTRRSSGGRAAVEAT